MVKKYLIFSICLVFYIGQINADSKDNLLSLIKNVIAEELQNLEKHYNQTSEGTNLMFIELWHTWANINDEMRQFRQNRLDYYAELMARHNKCSNNYKDLEQNSFNEYVYITNDAEKIVLSANELAKSLLHQIDELNAELKKLNQLTEDYFNNNQEDNTANINQYMFFSSIMKEVSKIKTKEYIYIMKLKKLPREIEVIRYNLKDQSYLKKYKTIMINIEKNIKDCITPKN